MAHFQISMAGARRIPLAGVALIAAVGPRAGSDRHHDRHCRAAGPARTATMIAIAGRGSTFDRAAGPSRSPIYASRSVS